MLLGAFKQGKGKFATYAGPTVKISNIIKIVKNNCSE